MKTQIEKIDKNQIDEQILAKAGEILKPMANFGENKKPCSLNLIRRAAN